MAHYIDKSALVAGIESLRRYYYIEKDDFDYGWNFALDKIFYLINTLEVKDIDTEQLTKLLNWWKDVATEHSVYKVKEVDLEKEIKEVQRNYKTIEGYEGYPCTMYANGIERIAKHFFELGLKAQKGE